MGFDLDEFARRLREAAGSDSQEVIGEKLHMSQGNVSRIFSGLQMAKMDSLYLAAEEYGVSVDWLLGLSEKKDSEKNHIEASYGLALKILLELYIKEGISIDDNGCDIEIDVRDPFLKMLLHTGSTLYMADRQLLRSWINTRVKEYESLPLLEEKAWHYGYGIAPKSEEEWMRAYKRASGNSGTIPFDDEDDQLQTGWSF